MASTAAVMVLGLVALAVVVTAITRRRKAVADRWHFRLWLDLGRDRTADPPPDDNDA